MLAFFCCSYGYGQQSGSLTIVNNTGCDLYVAGIGVEGDCSKRCVTPFYFVSASGAPVPIDPCDTLYDLWHSVIYTECMASCNVAYAMAPGAPCGSMGPNGPIFFDACGEYVEGYFSPGDALVFFD